MGDFAILKDLSEMFRHCKSTEDVDLNVFEFITEHISPIGQLIEGAEHEAEEDGDKPHQPIQNINCGQPIACVISQLAFSTSPIYHIATNQQTIYNDRFFASDYISIIYRPPIAA